MLAAGGFEADPSCAGAYLGQGWERAQGARHPAQHRRDARPPRCDAGAAPSGDWSGCHSVAWDAGAPANEGDRELTNQLTAQRLPARHHRQPRRPSASSTRAPTSATTPTPGTAREILAQPGGVAFQLFDASTRPLLRSEEYDMPGRRASQAATPSTSSPRSIGVDPAALERDRRRVQRRDRPRGAVRPAVKDGRAAPGSSRRRATGRCRWTRRRTTPSPSPAASRSRSAACAATTDGRVLDADGAPIPGLFVCGEMLGGLFSGNYPGGTGLPPAAVFGRRAGAAGLSPAVHVDERPDVVGGERCAEQRVVVHDAARTAAPCGCLSAITFSSIVPAATAGRP